MLSVLLAAGRGTRLQASSETSLTPAQLSAAASGFKAALPVNDRPFLDYILSSLADAGFDEACIIVRPDDSVLRVRYARLTPSRIRVRFVIQEKPLGTAHAVLTAASSLARSLVPGARPMPKSGAMTAFCALEAAADAEVFLTNTRDALSNESRSPLALVLIGDAAEGSVMFTGCAWG